MFAVDYEGVVPDMVTMAKGMAGGLPLAAVTGRADLMDAVHPGGLGGTYGGNPVACAAAIGALHQLSQDHLKARALEIEAIFYRATGRDGGNPPEHRGDRGRGAMIAAELVDPATQAPTPC